jgi:hypothetical protein
MMEMSMVKAPAGLVAGKNFQYWILAVRRG